MTDDNPYQAALQLYMMSDMEKLIWAATLALRADDTDGGVEAADAALRRLRDLRVTRDQRLDPEYEAARDNIPIEKEEFHGWFPVQHRIHHRSDPGPYVAPSAEEIEAAYVRYVWSRSDYW